MNSPLTPGGAPISRRQFAALAGALALAGCASARGPASAYAWRQDRRTLALMRGDAPLWQLNYDSEQDKPYFYPLRTPEGLDLAGLRPTDHPWHRGLWFSWKLINGVNYWEEDPARGLAAGRTLIRSVEAVPAADFSARITLGLAYAPEGGAPVLTEQRTLAVGAPTAGGYDIDWRLRFTALDREVTLDRTPPAAYGGETWGGYGGLSLRADEGLADHHFLDSEGRQRRESLTGDGHTARWMDLSARNGARAGGLTMLSHPANPRSPSPWYVWFETGAHAFFTPALLYHAPLVLPPHAALTLRYRTRVHTGAAAPAEAEAAWRAYAAAPEAATP